MPESYEEIFDEQRKTVLSYVDVLREKGIYSDSALKALTPFLRKRIAVQDAEVSEWASTESRLSGNSCLDDEMHQTNNNAWIRRLGVNLPTGNKQKSIQVSLSETQKLLLDTWSAADGKSLSGVAAEALSIGLAQLRKDRIIPEAAVTKYQIGCEIRMACTDIFELIKQDHPIDQDFEP